MAPAEVGDVNPWLARRRVIAWAHQGGALEGPANSPEAMRTALGKGVHGLEFDVRRTLDDQLVLHHDATMATRRGRFEIARSTLAELRGAKPDLATLEEVLTEFAGVPVTVEVKALDAAERTARRLARELGRRPVIVGSFNGAMIRVIKRAGPELDTAAPWPTATAVWVFSRLGLPAPVRRNRHVALQVAPGLHQVRGVRRIPLVRRLRVCDARFVRTAHRRGLAVHVWTLDDQRDIEQALAAGVDGILTDRPSVLVPLLDGVGWSGH